MKGEVGFMLRHEGCLKKTVQLLSGSASYNREESLLFKLLGGWSPPYQYHTFFWVIFVKESKFVTVSDFSM